MVSDLTARGASKARLVTCAQAASRSSLALAWRLYRDAGRVGELVDRNAVSHPAFLLTEGEASSFETVNSPAGQGRICSRMSASGLGAVFVPLPRHVAEGP
jgi:hypothetical protein